MTDVNDVIKNWWDEVSEAAKPNVLAVLDVVVVQSSDWTLKWAEYLASGQSSEAYRMVYNAMNEQKYLEQGAAISTADVAANTDNVAKIEAQKQALYALMTFGITAIKEAIPLLLAAL